MTARWTVHALAAATTLALAGLVLTACGPEEDVLEPPAPEPTEEPDDEERTEPPDDPEVDMAITGTFTGDPQLEGGCAWVDGDDGTRYEVMWPEGYEVTWDPLELRGPDGEVVARDGDEVHVTGSVARDMASICMVGTMFQARSVEAH